MATLNEIGEDMNALYEILSDVSGDVSEADAEAAIDAWLAENEGALKSKLEGYRAVYRALEKSAEFRREEAAIRQQAAERDEANMKRMKDRLQTFFAAHGLKRVDLPSGGCFNVCGNGGLQPIEIRVEPDALPVAYRIETVVRKADTDAIRAAIEAGEALDFAELLPRGTHLRIK